MQARKLTELTGNKQNLSGSGEVYSFSVMYNAPQGFEEQKPYAIALVKLDDGPMVTAQLTDVNYADVRIGMRVEPVWVDDADLTTSMENIRYWRPIDEPDVPAEQLKGHM